MSGFYARKADHKGIEAVELAAGGYYAEIGRAHV